MNDLTKKYEQIKQLLDAINSNLGKQNLNLKQINLRSVIIRGYFEYLMTVRR